jgi:hypothetical protein
MNKIALMLLASGILPAGCASAQVREAHTRAQMIALLGKTKDAVVEVRGAARVCTPLASDGEVCVWTRTPDSKADDWGETITFDANHTALHWVIRTESGHLYSDTGEGPAL